SRTGSRARDREDDFVFRVSRSERAGLEGSHGGALRFVARGSSAGGPGRFGAGRRLERHPALRREAYPSLTGDERAAVVASRGFGGAPSVARRLPGARRRAE